MKKPITVMTCDGQAMNAVCKVTAITGVKVIILHVWGIYGIKDAVRRYELHNGSMLNI